jgi:uncharacterized protein (TIGR04255 family)
MAVERKRIPAKMKDDAIVEALLEVRFDMSIIPEVLIGRLSEYGPWKQLSQQRTPAADIPAPIRQLNPQLRYLPVFELFSPESEGRRAVRIGPQVLSYHCTAPYVGWERFKPELQQAIEGLFQKADGLVVRRLGLRYLNALRPDVHGIRSVSDLDLKLEIDGERVGGNVNVNFTVDPGSDKTCTVRIATPEFIQGALPANTSVYVDVDVFTHDGYESRKEADVTSWLEAAHTKEKQQFFRLLTVETINSLKENR